MPSPASPVGSTALAAHVLAVEHLRTAFHTTDGVVRAVDDVSWTLARGEILGVVGESGCGKSVTALSVMGLVPEPPGRVEGSIRLNGRELIGLDEAEMRRIRGNAVSMVFQEPMTSLDPVMRIGKQIAEPLIQHQGLARGEARARAIELLRRVRIPEPERRADEFPHQLSGGMRQRVMIAMALACQPAVLLADEPTTALDVTIQAQILEMMAELRAEIGTAIVFITHDLGVVAEIADRVAVLYAGRIVEQTDVVSLFDNACHPYTRGLMRSIPRLSRQAGGAVVDRLTEIKGTVPAPTLVPVGCAFSPRCGSATKQCAAEPFALPLAPSHLVACWHPEMAANAGD